MRKCILTALAALLTLGAAARDLKATPGRVTWEAPEKVMVEFSVEDTTGSYNESKVTLRIVSDCDENMPVFTFNSSLKLKPGKTHDYAYQIKLYHPGFFKCTVSDDGNVIKEWNIGYEPSLVLSLPDSKPDFDQFWSDALAELATVPGEYSLVHDPEKSGNLRKAFAVTMKSLGGETLKGYLYIPNQRGVYPATIHYHGYGGKIRTVDADANPDWIDYYPSVRGQYYSEPDNTYCDYGDWIGYRIDDPKEYYYRGAYMDAIRAIDFIAQLEGVDKDLIFAEGGSQGGALTLVAASLDDRIAAIAPYIPFLTDFPHYFKIVDWPGNIVKRFAEQYGISEEQMYDNLTYFDVKNLVRRITCPVIMGISMQDNICPPHTNVASYSLIRSPKDLTIYPYLGHWVDQSDWAPKRDAFFNSIVADKKRQR